MDMNIEILGNHVDQVVRNLERFSREVKPLGGHKGVRRRRTEGEAWDSDTYSPI